MSDLKAQLLCASIEALGISVLTGLIGGAELGAGNQLSAIGLILLSLLNMRNATTRFELFRAQD